jgi:progressive ankylosis protein
MTQDRSARAVLVFWIPLALQWVMMALEGPFLAAVIARLPDPAFNLAAYGVAFAFAILVESPVIMLMSASTALVEDGDSYRKLRRFAGGLNLLSTGLLLLVLLPPVYDLVMRSGLGLPEPVADLAYGALWLLLPWPAAIGYRRFLHGLLIRSGRTRRVAYGTGIRLAAMAGTALLLARTGVPGVWVGASALSAGVMVEALVARFMARQVVRELVEAGGVPPSPVAPPEPEAEGEPVAGSGGAGAASRAAAPESHAPGSHLTFGTIARFYYPLALTSLIGLTTQPILTFFMGRSPSPVESLALFPVVMGVAFLFNTLGLSFQEAAIALVGRRWEHARPLARFALGLAVVASGGLGALAFTPLADVWFRGVAGLAPELAALAITPVRVAVILPFLGVVLGFQRALLVQARDTRPITLATALEVAGIALLFPVLGWGVGMMGVTAAFGALLGGRVLGVGFLLLRMGRVRLSAP